MSIQYKLNIKDPNSFEVLQFGFTKDKFHVYDNDSIVEGADCVTALALDAF